MNVRIRNSDWESDGELQRKLSKYVTKGLQRNETLSKYVTKGLQRNEILSYMLRDFPQYSWSIRTTFVSLNNVKEAVKGEFNDPGKLLSYRAMHLKIREKNGLNVTRDQVCDVVTDIDLEGLRQRQPWFKRKKEKDTFTAVGANWVVSLDGHDKLMGFLKSTFPLTLYVCIDTASQKILFLKVWTSNSNPAFVLWWYFEYLYKSKILPNYTRVDKGTETATLSTMHAYLSSLQMDVQTEDEACECVIYGPSTSNQIKRWWRELHERHEQYYKEDLQMLKNRQLYIPHYGRERDILSFVLIPIIQREVNTFKDEVWNVHRIKKQKNTELPNGIPNHTYDFPFEYSLCECSKNLQLLLSRIKSLVPK